MQEFTATLITQSPRCQLGEGPLWDHRTGTLHWIDIVGKAIHQLTPTGGIQSQPLDKMVGFIALTPDPTRLIAGLQDGIAQIKIGQGLERYLCRPEAESSGNRFNDGKTDPYGRIYAGTMPLSGGGPQGTLYRIDPNLSTHPQLTGLRCSNGLAFSNDHRTLYYIDTPTRTIDSLDYDPKTGVLSNRRPVIDLTARKGMPDGMCIDAEGQLWVGLWAGHGVARFNPTSGQQTAFIPVPAPNVTCCAFGGPDLKTLYITTAGSNPTDYPLSGHLFSAQLNVTGIESVPFSIKNR